MSIHIPTHFVTTFENNMKLSLNQTKPMIWPHLIPRAVSGEKSELDDLIGHVKSQKGGERHGDTKYNNTPGERVWVVKPEADYYADLVDREDQIAAKIAIGSGYMQTALATINRAKDDAFLAAFFGNQITGKTGTTLLPFPNGNIVPVGTGSTGPTRMNIAKLRAARKLRAKNFNDMNEEAFMVLTAEQIDDLLDEMPVTSKEFAANGGELRDGRLSRLMGFTFIEWEMSNPLLWNAGLTLDGNGYRKNPFWTKSGMYGCTYTDLFTSIDRMPGKRHSTQIYAETIITATRSEAGKVGYILNVEN